MGETAAPAGDRQVVHQTQQSSCEIGTTSKGEPVVTVKVYNDNPATAGALALEIYLRTAAAVKKEPTRG